jgi:hypothetical protein
MRISDVLLTGVTFVTFIIALYLFTSDPMLSSSVNWAEDRQSPEVKSARADVTPPAQVLSDAPATRTHIAEITPGFGPASAPAVNCPPSGIWKYIVIHHSATKQGNAAIFDNYHRNTKGMKDGLAYHFVIGNGTKSKDGQIEVGRRWDRQIAGMHCFDNKMNQESIGICLVGNFDLSVPTERQMQSLLKLIADLQAQYRIPKSNIRLHQEVDKRQTNCPGKKFPADKVR